MALLVTPALAHEVDDVPSRTQLVDELRAMNATLRQAQADLDTSLAVDSTEVVKVLTEAQVAWLAEDHPRVALLLMNLIAKPAFKDHPAWPEALEYLGESMHALGLSKAAVTYLREAVDHPRQLPTPWRRRFARLLALGGRELPLPELRALWRRHEESVGDEEGGEQGPRYQYAKALVHHGELSEADEQFSRIPERDAWYLQALYFRAIIQLKQDQQVKAQAAFEEALAAWRRLAPPPAARPYLEDIDDDGPARELITLPVEAVSADLTAAEAAARYERLGAVIHLALARLAAARKDDAAAWLYYRQIPRGDPDFAAAQAEASFVLFRREQYAWCVRLVDQLLAGRGDDVSATQLTLWKAQLQARAGAFEDSFATYRLLTAGLAQAEVDAPADERRVFGEGALRWTDPDEAIRIRRLETDLVVQEESLREAREIADLLAELVRSDALLPAVARGRDLLEQIDARMAHFTQHLDLARKSAHSEEDDDLHGGGPPATPADLDAFAASQETLRQRLDRFEGQLETFETSYRKRIASVLAAEVPVVAELERALGTEVASARALGPRITDAARENLEQYAAEARFGEVDIAWWQKEVITRQVKQAMLEQGAVIKAVDQAMAPPPPPPPEVARPPGRDVDDLAPGEAPERDEAEGDETEGDETEGEQPPEGGDGADDYEEAAADPPTPPLARRESMRRRRPEATPRPI